MKYLLLAAIALSACSAVKFSPGQHVITTDASLVAPDVACMKEIISSENATGLDGRLRKEQVRRVCTARVDAGTQMEIVRDYGEYSEVNIRDGAARGRVAFISNTLIDWPK